MILFSFTCLGQINKLKPEFRNVSWINDSKTAEIVTTLSKHYGTVISKKKSDSVFVTKERYNLYEDSLMLWKLTKDAFKEKNSKAKSTIIGNFGEAKTKHSISEWLVVFDNATRESYADNGNSTVGDNACIASTYDNINFFYAKESESVKSYNNKRIKLYSSQSNGYYDTINFYVAVHKTIKPIDTYAVSYYGHWLPYMYVYAKPKQVVYPAPPNKLWETKTGLPYELAQELKLDADRIPKVLKLFGVVNDEVLLSEDKEYNFTVSCDTCNVKLFDNDIEDDDVIGFTYSNETSKIAIKNAPTNYQIVLAKDNEFKILALSEGNLETCTVNTIIDDKNYIFALKKGERVSIKLHK